MTRKPRRRLGAELTGYQDATESPRRLRVDIVDRNAVTVLASLTPGEALQLVTEMLNAVNRAREENGGRGEWP